MIVQIAVLFITHLAVPLFFIYSVWNGKDDDRLGWLLKVLYSGVFIGYIFLIGRWDWISYYVRYISPVLFIVACIVSYRRARALPFFARRGWKGWVGTGSSALVLAVFLGLLGYAGSGLFYRDVPVRMSFPLRDGWYYVGQGGNSTLLNYHNPNRSQQYALDIVALNPFGTRASGIYPTELERYVIFGKPLHSPCDGEIVEAVDGLPDQIPPAADTENLAGNHVIIACEGVKVLLAHMQNGSVQVQTGQRVATGDLLGQVGNSGNTSEPHLHIHAVQASAADVLDGDGVPLLFDDHFAVRNDTFAVE